MATFDNYGIVHRVLDHQAQSRVGDGDHSRQAHVGRGLPRRRSDALRGRSLGRVLPAPGFVYEDAGDGLS